MEYTLTDLQIIKQCVEVATFQGSSTKAVAMLLDKIDYNIEQLTAKEPANKKS